MGGKGWETCLYWFERPPRRLWVRHPDGKDTTDEYATPPSVFQRFGSACTLDVCATAGKAMCTKHFTKAQDGLKRPWHGTVWMNPPYSVLYPWCAKAYKYAKAGGTVIALLPAWTDAPWFHDFVGCGRRPRQTAARNWPPWSSAPGRVRKSDERVVNTMIEFREIAPSVADLLRRDRDRGSHCMIMPSKAWPGIGWRLEPGPRGPIRLTDRLIARPTPERTWPHRKH